MLGVFFDSTPDSINRGLRLTQALRKEGFEFFSDNENVVLIPQLAVILLQAKQSGIFPKIGSK